LTDRPVLLRKRGGAAVRGGGPQIGSRRASAVTGPRKSGFVGEKSFNVTEKRGTPFAKARFLHGGGAEKGEGSVARCGA